MKGVQFIQESGPERLEIKQYILAQAEQFASPEAVLLRKECPGFTANRLQLALYREVQD